MAAASAPIPLLDLSREYAAIREDVLAAIADVCDHQQFILGPAAQRFEEAAAALCAVPGGVGCASGTDALWLALAALGIGPGDAVITTPFSFYATASAILRVGATPIFADIHPGTLNLSPESVQQVLAAARPPGLRVRALLPVHLYGQCADMDALQTLAEQHDLLIVEDAAQAFGARWRDRPAGSLGDSAAFSFYPTKNLSAFGDAGLLTAPNLATLERARALRNHGMRRRYFHDDLGGPIGWNSRLDGIQAAVLEIKLRRLPAGNARRRTLAALYDRLFQESGLAAPAAGTGTGCGSVQVSAPAAGAGYRLALPCTDPRAEHIFHQYVIRVARRDELRAYLGERGIGSEVYYPLCLHEQQSLRALGYSKGAFPEAELAATEVLALPIYPELREDEVEAVVHAIQAFYA